MVSNNFNHAYGTTLIIPALGDINRTVSSRPVWIRKAA